MYFKTNARKDASGTHGCELIMPFLHEMEIFGDFEKVSVSISFLTAVHFLKLLQNVDPPQHTLVSCY